MLTILRLLNPSSIPKYLYIWAPHMEEIPSMRNADSILPIFRTRVILM